MCKPSKRKGTALILVVDNKGFGEHVEYANEDRNSSRLCKLRMANARRGFYFDEITIAELLETMARGGRLP